MTQKILGRWDSVAISIGIVIGVGIFRVPAEVAHHLHSAAWILAAWVIGGVFSLLGALCYAELASIYPESGGDYIYLRECYGKLTAFLFAWSELLITRTGSVAAIALMFGEYATSLFSLSSPWIKPLAVSVVALLAICNLYGLKTGSRLQNIFTFTKVGALLIILACGLASIGSASNPIDFSELASPEPSYLTLIGVALVPILWTYGGWRDNVFLAGETRDASSSVPFALLATCLVVTLIYGGMNFLYLSYIPISQIEHSKLIATDLLTVLYGPSGAKMLEALIVIYGFGAINALLLTGSRIAHAMAEDNPLCQVLSKVDEKTGTPVRALAFNTVWSCVLILTGSFEMLLFFTGLAVWIFFALVTGSILAVRRKKDLPERYFKTPCYPLTPVLVSAVSLLLAYSTITYLPRESLIGIGLVLLGVPLYFLQGKIVTAFGKIRS